MNIIQKTSLFVIGLIPIISSLIFALFHSLYYFLVIVIFLSILSFLLYSNTKHKTSILKLIKNISNKDWILIIIILTLSIRLLWVFFIPSIPFSDFADYNNLGHRLSIGEGYVNDNGQPTAERMIGYPAFLGLIYYVFGYNIILPKIINVFLSLFIVLLTYLIAKKTFSEDVARISSLIVVFFPTQIFFTSVLSTEILFTVLMLFSIYLLIRKERNEMKYTDILAFGIVSGVSLLTRSMTFLFPIFVFIYFFSKIDENKLDHYKKKYVEERFRKSFIFLLISLLGMSLIISPWIYRNYNISGRPMLSSFNGDSLWISFNENSTGGYLNSMDYIFPNITNEFERSGILTDAGLSFLLKNPIKVIELGFKKLYILFGSDTGLGSYSCKDDEYCKIIDYDSQTVLTILSNTYYIAIVFIFAISMLFIRIRNEKVLLLLLIIFNWMIIHFFMQAQGRYHFPIIPLISIFSAYALNHYSKSPHNNFNTDYIKNKLNWKSENINKRKMNEKDKHDELDNISQF